MIRRVIYLIGLIGLLCGLMGCENDSPTSLKYDRLVYVAMGASDAVGIGAFPLENGYVYRIRDGLKDYADEVKLHNLGVSGKGIDYIEDTELPKALTHNPDIVTLWAGPNDIIGGMSVEAFDRALASTLAQLRQQTSAIIVIANVPDMTKVPRFVLFPDDDVTKDRILAYNGVIQRQATTFGAPIVDLYAGGYATDWEYVSIDGFHPSNDGHAKIANLFLSVLSRYL